MCVCVCVCVCVCECVFRGPVHEFVHGWGPASLARGRAHGQLASLPAGRTLVEGTICILAFYYIGYTLSGQIIVSSEIIIIWPLSV